MYFSVFWQNSCCLRACNTLSSQCFVLICDANDSSITLHHCIQLFVNLIMCHGWKLVSCLLSDKITFHELFICVLAVLFKIKKFENMYSQPSWVIVMEVIIAYSLNYALSAWSRAIVHFVIYIRDVTYSLKFPSRWARRKRRNRSFRWKVVCQ